VYGAMVQMIAIFLFTAARTSEITKPTKYSVGVAGHYDIQELLRHGGRLPTWPKAGVDSSLYTHSFFHSSFRILQPFLAKALLSIFIARYTAESIEILFFV
jgi:hypothetical protein